MKDKTGNSKKKIILAVVGMPGAGKTEATSYLETKGIPFVRFGDMTDEGVKNMGLPLTPDNERIFREKIRKELGMAAYAIKAEGKISELLEKNDMIAIDGLYSWEEYTYLKNNFSGLTLIHIYAEPQIRYARLAKRTLRPVPINESRIRDISEIEKLNKGGPIAIADHLIINDKTLFELHGALDNLFTRLNSL